MGVLRRLGGMWLALALLCTGGGRMTAAAADPDPAAILSEGLFSCAEVIDLGDCALPAEALGGLYARVLWENPELFHVAPRLTYRSREDGSGGGRLVWEVYPVYIQRGEELTAARALYEDTVAGILAEMDRAFGERTPTEAERVLYLHDLLAQRYGYDTRTEGKNGDAYTLFRDGVGVCQAYALAFIALARGAGLEADFVASAAMDHAWNHVRVDGVWYHVDVTRDDPIPAADGREAVNHTRLLRSDEGMEALGYHGFSCGAGHTCTDTRFESDGAAALEEFHAAVIPVGEGWMAAREDGAPVSVQVGDGFSTGQRGDADGDEKITPADLLTLYRESCPEAWREWVRGELVK